MSNYKTVYVDKKQIREHRHVMESFLGRKLSAYEIVHHIDGDKTNNLISNLELLSRSEHAKKHVEDGDILKHDNTKYQYDYELIKKLYLDDIKSSREISELLFIPESCINWFVRKNGFKRVRNKCKCGEYAIYTKSNKCKKCYLKDYYQSKKVNYDIR